HTALPLRRQRRRREHRRGRGDRRGEPCERIQHGGYAPSYGRGGRGALLLFPPAQARALVCRDEPGDGRARVPVGLLFHWIFIWIFFGRAFPDRDRRE